MPLQSSPEGCRRGGFKFCIIEGGAGCLAVWCVNDFPRSESTSSGGALPVDALQPLLRDYVLCMDGDSEQPSISDSSLPVNIWQSDVDQAPLK